MEMERHLVSLGVPGCGCDLGVRWVGILSVQGPSRRNCRRAQTNTSEKRIPCCRSRSLPFDIGVEARKATLGGSYGRAEHPDSEPKINRGSRHRVARNFWAV